jgi:hypothetical protein
MPPIIFLLEGETGLRCGVAAGRRETAGKGRRFAVGGGAVEEDGGWFSASVD